MRRGVKKALAVTTAAAAISGGLALITKGAQPEVLEDIGYHRSEGDPRYRDIEGRMTTALNTMYDTDVHVRCADPVPDSKTKLGPRGSSYADTAVSSTQDFWLTWTDDRYVRLAPALCKEIEGVDRVNKYNPAQFGKVAYAVSALAFQGAQASHEGQDASAGVMECYAIQESAHLARELGAGVNEARDMGKLIALGGAGMAGEGQEPPRGCADDQKYDLIPNSPGFFPNGGSASYPAPGN